MKITFWQVIPSPHQSACLRSLAEMGHEVTLVADRECNSERRKIGWTSPDLGAVHLVLAPTIDIMQTLLRTDIENTIHITAGTRSARCASFIVNAAQTHNLRIGMLGEPGDPRGVTGLLRRLLYSVEAIQIRKKIDFYLAMGGTGVKWYISSGYPSDKVYSYAYVAEKIKKHTANNIGNNALHVCFAGSLIKRKDAELLLKALIEFPTSMWSLTMIGNGPESAKLMSIIKKCNVSQNVQFKGFLPTEKTQELISQSDLFVLPSQFDGWGAVVNEALMCGVPVICSDQCGASDLLRESWRGSVFRAQSARSLVEALRPWLERGPMPTDQRERIREWSKNIDGWSVANYLTAILEHVYEGKPRPEAPWRKVNCDSPK
ncbi:MAG: glycosyltransferase [bacterium]